jgi:hypothetical protein
MNSGTYIRLDTSDSQSFFPTNSNGFRKMLKLHKKDALTISQLAKKAAKKIPLYEERNKSTVKVPFLDVRANKMRFLMFSNLSGYIGNGEWTFIEIVD